MFKLFRKRKMKKIEPENQEVKKMKDIPVSHLMVPFIVDTRRGVIDAKFPHVMTEFFLKNKETKSKDNESRE